MEFDPKIKCCHVSCNNRAHHSEIALGKGYLWDAGYWMCDECLPEFEDELNDKCKEEGVGSGSSKSED